MNTASPHWNQVQEARQPSAEPGSSWGPEIQEKERRENREEGKKAERKGKARGVCVCVCACSHAQGELVSVNACRP